MKNKVFQILIGAVLTILLLLLSNLTPWMPSMGVMFALICAAVLLVIFAGFVMQENGGDEREVLNRMNAGRIAYLSGIGVLTVALVVQGLSHAIDPWILITLGVMVLTKIIGRLYYDTYK